MGCEDITHQSKDLNIFEPIGHDWKEFRWTHWTSMAIFHQHSCSIISPRCAQLRKASPWTSLLRLAEAALPSSLRSAREVPAGDACHLQRLGQNKGKRVPKDIFLDVCRSNRFIFYCEWIWVQHHIKS